jgi:hypothetical protein
VLSFLTRHIRLMCHRVQITHRPGIIFLDAIIIGLGGGEFGGV